MQSDPGSTAHATRSLPFLLFMCRRCQPYVACSADSTEGFCSNVDTTCTALNTCRTCSTFSDSGGNCVALDYYPNATVSFNFLVSGKFNV